MNNSLDIATVTGFDSKDVHELQARLEEDLQPNSSNMIPSAPLERAEQHPEIIVEQVVRDLDKNPSTRRLLIGHSYGALIALVVACRDQIDGIVQLVLIDGPLSPHVEVEPAITAHEVFSGHYAYRKILAEECEATLAQRHTFPILTICTENDRIVPPDAKALRGGFENIRLQTDEDVAALVSSKDTRKNVFLPPQYKGHGIQKKIRIISHIIRSSLSS